MFLRSTAPLHAVFLAEIRAESFYACSMVLCTVVLCELCCCCLQLQLTSSLVLQGRTSRWAIAWSFSADPQSESIPMPRYSPLQSATD